MASARPGPSRRLPRGLSALDADTVADHRRRRLHAAAVTLLGEQGYGVTTVRDLTSQAEVSTRDFYELFAGKQQLVLDTCDTIVATACGRLRPAAGGDLRGGLHAVLDGVVDVVASAPAEARLAVVEIVAVGPAGVERRRSLTVGLHTLLRRAATLDGAPVMSEAALAVLAGGTLQVLDRHLRSGRLRPLRGAAVDLAAWGALYETRRPRPLPGRDPLIAPSSAPTVAIERLPSGRHGLPAGFIRGHQRARILEAVLAVSQEQGFEAASVKELMAAAGVSPKAFYDSFPSKHDAWTVAFEEAFSQLYLAAWRAARAQKGHPAQVAAGIAACLDYLASEPQRARLLLVDAATAGRAGAPAIDEALEAAVPLMTRTLAGAGAQKVVPPAMVGGIVALGAGWILEDRTAQLPDLAAPLVEVILTPSLGLAAAARAADAMLRGPEDGAVHDDRRRLIDAFAETVARDGLPATRLSDVAQAQGIELDVARALFADELDCATKALDEWASRLVIIAAGAFLAAAADPPLAAHHALEAALWHIARAPAVAALAVSDDTELARAASALRERYVALFFQLVAGQVPVARQRSPQPAVALAVVLDGLLATLRRFAQQDRVNEMPAQLEALSLQCLTPFFGADEARRVAELSRATPPR
jgi:AcrR family transcriptional regulator